MSYLAWIDLETTGLDSRICSIIEVACVVTDDSLEEQNRFHSFVELGAAFWEPGALELHSKTGLITEWQARSTYPHSIDVITQDLILLLEPFDRPTQAGSSPHFDRAFIRDNPVMNGLTDYLHYRLLDVSSVRRAVAMFTDTPVNDLLPSKESEHRALDDALASLEAMRWYRDNIGWKERT